MTSDESLEALRGRYESTWDFDDGLRYVEALRRAGVVGSSSLEAIADDLFSGWDRARIGEPWSEPIAEGALVGLELSAIHQQIFQFICLNALFLYHEGQRYLYLPQPQHEQLSTLWALPWPEEEVIGARDYGALLTALVAGTPWRGLTPKGAPIRWAEAVLRPLDVAPLVDERLRALASGEGSPEALSAALGLLELLLRFKGGGSEEVSLALVALDAPRMVAELEAWEAALREPALAAIEGREGAPLGVSWSDQGGRIGALALRVYAIDGTSGGWVVRLAELELTFEVGRGFVLDRRTLWEKREEGMELT